MVVKVFRYPIPTRISALFPILNLDFLSLQFRLVLVELGLFELPLQSILSIQYPRILPSIIKFKVQGSCIIKCEIVHLTILYLAHDFNKLRILCLRCPYLICKEDLALTWAKNDLVFITLRVMPFALSSCSSWINGLLTTATWARLPINFRLKASATMFALPRWYRMLQS